MKCRICNNYDGNIPLTLYEMMYGTRESFTYFTCGGCGCLQIAEIPASLNNYYPQDYYSYAVSASSKSPPGMLSRKKFNYIFFRKGLVGKFLDRLKPEAYNQFRCFQRVDFNRQSRILDVGCGSGRDLVKMREHGFTDLTGIDPYIPDSIDYGQGLRVLRKSLCDLDGEWDIIKFNHVFEHISDPVDALYHVRRLLAPKGTCIIRIPVIPCEVFEEYGTDWVQLDAPRHLYLYSFSAMEILAGKVGLKTDRDRIYCDSVSDQFWGSELYRRGISLVAGSGNLKSHFSKQEIKKYKNRAKLLNSRGRGDQAVFYFTR